MRDLAAEISSAGSQLVDLFQVL